MSISVAVQPRDVAASQSDRAAVAQRPAWSRRVAADLVALGDSAAFVVGALLPMSIYSNFGGIDANWYLTVQSGLASAIFGIILLRSWGMYDSDRLHDLPERPGRLLTGLLVTLIAVIGFGIPYALEDWHIWIWYAAWAAASYTLLLGNRIVARRLLAHYTAARRFEERVAVYGAGQIARRVHDDLSTRRNGIEFVGVFDDRADDNRINPEGLSVCGRLDDLIQAGRNGGVDKIVIALPQGAEYRMARIAAKLEQLPVSVHLVTHLSSDLLDEPTAHTHSVSNIGSVGLLDIKRKPLSDWDPIIKRGEDLVIAGGLLLLSAPLFPLIAAMIKLESAGPVFFVQKRRGLNRQDIDVLKFRTMRVLENGETVKQAAPGDERVTRFGRILRRLSLDELPQLVNVLRGDMSLVGPRPHAIAHDDQFANDLDTYANRHQVKPGITGLAQVDGFRGPTPAAEDVSARVNRDITYIRQWSLWLDLKILMRTFWVVLSGRNAV